MRVLSPRSLDRAAAGGAKGMEWNVRHTGAADATTARVSTVSAGRPVVRLATASAVGMGLAGCLPEAVTRQGAEVSRLYTIFMAAAAVVFVVVVALLAWVLVRYRAGRDPGELPVQTEGNLRLEIAWWVVPSVIIAVLTALTATVLVNVDARADEPDVTVRVEGFQWQWRFTYEDAGVVVTGTPEERPRVVLPVDERIAFVVTSRDVIHSFSIPRFLIKRDAVPGRENRFEVEITDEGTYTGQCGEFCGLLHSAQLFSIEAVSRADYEAWLTKQGAAAGTGNGDG
jgi:cytochrome c oxidase subunit 2